MAVPGHPSDDEAPESAVAELEGGLLKDPDPFPYFMLVAFEASGPVRFALLLLLWPLVRLLRSLGRRGLALRVTAFASVAGVRESEVRAVARAVLPKFFADDVDVGAWRAFRSAARRVVVTGMPREMVEWFAAEHLGADAVVGPQLQVRRGFVTGLIERGDDSAADRVRTLLEGGEPPSSSSPRTCKEQRRRPFLFDDDDDVKRRYQLAGRPPPVIFHDGRLVPRPTPGIALLIVLWMPFGIAVAAVRMLVGIVVPLRFHSHLVRLFGGDVIVRGTPPPPATGTTSGVLFVCTHRTLLDPVVLSMVLGRNVAAVTYSISRFSEVLSPIPTVQLARDREVDAGRIEAALAKGDLAVCPEGTTCREPFLLRFSALFAELTDRIVPVAMNYRVGFFHATTARGWKAMDAVFFFMNPRPVYQVTFLRRLPAEQTCWGGRSAHEVANDVQRMLAATLGFECTSFTRKDKYKVLAGNDGRVAAMPAERRRLGSYLG